MLNKKVLSKIDLGSYTKPNPFHKDIIYDPKGQWEHPGQNTRIPGGDITMQGVPYPVYAQPNVGQPQMMYPDQNYQFPGADYVDEFPQMKKGGRIKGLVSMPKPSKKGLMSNKYSRSLDATNKLFTENFLFAKPKSRKNKVFDPNAKYYAKGGALLTKEVTCKKCGWEWDAADGGKDITTCHKCGGQGLVHAQNGGNKDGMTGMMKARLAYANEFGNPAAKRMINLPDNPYQFDNGDTGSHYMASYDNYAVPQIQDENGVLQLGDYGPESNEAIRFDSDEDADYFAENYKNVSPGFIEADLDEDEIEEYRKGGYVVEEIDNYQDGGDNQSNGETYKYLGRPDSLYKKSLNGRWSISNKSTGNKFVSIEDPNGSRTKELNKNAVTVSSLNKKRRDHLIKLHKEIAFPKEFVDLKDTRTVRATTGEKINPNVDLKGDKYNKAIIDNIIKKSKAVGVDPSTMLAIALQETNFGKKDANLGHTLHGDTAYPYGYIDFYKQKLNEAKRAKIDNELLQIQYYNGLGTVTPETEEDYHGFKMQKIYGVPIPAGGINMRKNPLYGKQIVDLRDNVVLKNPYIQKALKEKKQGGASNDYVDAELTPKEIKDLIAQGYVIEELN
jgi:hypothetical protein